ncbi:glutaminase kidney isoform, mitochondrial isoform X3 [Ahaetulla prasina]|nr:glutaminase kidney isoform, mitochondrial isoform X3 [Ahaetulla prasina]
MPDSQSPWKTPDGYSHRRPMGVGLEAEPVGCESKARSTGGGRGISLLRRRSCETAGKGGEDERAIMMRLRSPALLRDLLWLSQTGTGGALSCCRRSALRWLHPAWPGVAGGRSPLRLMPGAAASAASRALCTSSEGILEQTGKGPPAQQPPAPTTSAAEMPASAPGQNSHNAAASKEAGVLGENKGGLLPSLEDLLFYTIAEGQEKIPVHKFITALKSTGLRTADPRLKECMDMLRLTLQTTSDGVMLDKDLFKKCVQSNIVLLTQAFRRKFVIPDFMSFASHIDELYENAKKQSGGKVADYIPQLAKFSPDLWAVSVCTVDGQRHSIGDTKVPFCLQSCVKPLKYAIAVNDLGTDYVHRYVGKEPSGLRFNKLFLNEDDKPHNPMVNAGAIVITSLIKQGANNAEKFDYVMQFMNKMAGNEYVGFSNATFQSERESGDRNFAIGYYLKEKKCFPEGTDMVGILDFYFQLCSIEVTCESASVMAATLANGGFCPITGERVLSPEAVRNTLSLMHSCGMYDFSGQFAFHVGLPAKSGVAGGILLVVPNVMGMMCWSPPLDKMGNSVKGIHFCHELVSLCNFHNYDNLRHFAKKLDPRREGGDQRVKSVINLLFAAYTGDVSALRRFALSGMDMEQRDYDSRTALHVAAAEGHVEVVKFLLEACKVNPFPKDRWNNTPMDEALHFGHHDVFKILQEYQVQYTPPDNSSNGKENQTVQKNLDGLL